MVTVSDSKRVNIFTKYASRRGDDIIYDSLFSQFGIVWRTFLTDYDNKILPNSLTNCKHSQQLSVFVCPSQNLMIGQIFHKDTKEKNDIKIFSNHTSA